MLPSGISTALVTMKAPVSFTGRAGRIHVTITSSVPLFYDQGGMATPLADFLDTIQTDPGVDFATRLPHTNQTGFVDGSGAAFINWHYIITIKLITEGQVRYLPPRTLQITTGTTTVDLGKVTGGAPATPTAPNPGGYVFSVNGVSGAITLTKGSVGLSNVDNIADLQKPVSVPQADAIAAAKYHRGAMAGTADFDTFMTDGVFRVGSSTGKTNIPVAAPGTLWVQMIATDATIIQHFQSSESTPRTFSRRYSGGVWGPWRVGTWSAGLLVIGTDFDTVTTLGVYGVQSASHPNQPVALIGTLEVIPASATYSQRYTTSEARPHVYVRRWSGSVWGAWSALNWDQGLLATGIDFDAVTVPGIYAIQFSTHPNQPVPVIGTLEVIPASGAYSQRFTSSEPRPHVYLRRFNSGVWGSWQSQTWDQGIVVNGTDFNAITVLGIYAVQSISHPNQPVPVIGTLEVIPASGLYSQRYTTHEATAQVFVRRYVSATGWGAWGQPGGGGGGGTVYTASGFGIADRDEIAPVVMTETSKASNEIMVAMSADRTRGWNANGTALKETRDEGETWTTAYTFPAGTSVESVLPLDNGELLVFIYNGASSMRWGYLSSGYGTPAAAWNIVITGRLPSIKFAQSWSMFAHENIVLVNEYGPKEGFPWGNIEMVQPGENAAYTFMSLDYGKTWTTIFDLNAYMVSKGRSTVGQHPHGIAWDKYWDRIWYTFGDNNGGSGCNGILYSDDLGATWKEADFFSGPNGTQTVGIMPMPKCVLFAGDTNPSGLYRINRAEGKQRTGFYTKDLAYDAPADMNTHLCQGICRIDRVGDDAPAFFGFGSELNAAPSFIIATLDGYSITQIWKDTVNQPVGMGIRSVVGPTLRGKLIASSNDLKVAGKWSQLKGISPGY